MNMSIRTGLSLIFIGLILVGCGNNEGKQEIQPAQKLTNDATAVANEAWILINQLDQQLYSGETHNLDESIRTPLRELSNRWRIEVKMTDSVAEGKYALCRKALNSLDMWARSIKENGNDITKKRLAYEHDKNLCKDAVEHPELGNTPPKLTQKPNQ